MEDMKIIELYFERSQKAIKETAAKYGKYCWGIAYNILFNIEDADESVNDTYTDAWNSIPPHRPQILSSFLGKITRRISIDKLRNRNALKRGGGEMPLVLDELRECVSDTKTVEGQLDNQHLSFVINNFVLSLNKTQQQIFICRYWYLDSVKDISKHLGISQSKVKSVLFRLREKLRKILEEEGF